jgi:hypothetical protein
MDVRLPDGTVVQGVPDGTTKAQLAQKLKSNGREVPKEWLEPPKPTSPLVSHALNAVGFLASGGPMGRVGRQGLDELDKAIYEGGGMATDAASKMGASPEVAGGIGYAANVAGQAASAVVGGPAAKLAGKLEKPTVSFLGKKLSQEAETLSAKNIREAKEAKYVLTPTQLDQGTVPRAVEGLAGSAKTEKLASIKNQRNTNRMVAEDLGLKGRTITLEDLETIRKEKGAVYEEIKSSVKLIKPDDKFRKDLQGLRGDFTEASKAYPDLIKNEGVETLIKALDVPASPRQMVELTKKLRKDATSNLKAYDDPAKQALGMAQRNASNALEEMIQRALQSVGKKDLVDKWRGARTTIAKTYDIEAALNETTGDVSANYLGKLYKSGKPLTGNMEKAAKFARAFEGSARDVGKMRDATEFGYGDLFLGGLGGLAGHVATGGATSLAGLGLVGARPAARHLMLSTPYQALAGRQGLSEAMFGLSESNPYAFAISPALGLKPPNQ